MTINHFSCKMTMLLGGALLTRQALAQPLATAPQPLTQPTQPATLSLAELEKLIGGRTVLTLKLKDATLEDAAAAISASSGLKVKARSGFYLSSSSSGASSYTREAFVSVTGPDKGAVSVTTMGPRYSFEATGQPFWEAFLAWQRAALAAQEVPPPETAAAPSGAALGRRVNAAVALFGMQTGNDGLWLQNGNPISKGRTLVKWPYVMVGTRLNRHQDAGLDEVGLQPIDDSNRSSHPTSKAVPTSVFKPPTQEERWLDGLMLQTLIYLDPKIRPSNLRCEVEEAIDEKGNDLRLTDRTAKFFARTEFYSGDGNGIPVSIKLSSSPNMGKKLVRLRGTLRFTVVARTQHWETTDLDKPTAGNLWREGSDFAVQFNGLTKVGNGWQASFGAQSEGAQLKRLMQWGGGFSIFTGNDFVVQIIDDTGQVFTPGGIESDVNFHPIRTDHGDVIPLHPGDSPLPADLDKWSYTEKTMRSFDPRFNRSNSAVMGRPVKIMIDLPTERREVVIPFEFTDLPLPPTTPEAK